VTTSIATRGLLVVIAWAALATVAAAQPGMQQPMTPPMTPTMTPAPSGFVYPPPPLGRSGYFGAGLSVEPLNLGSIQAITSHGSAAGVDVGVAAQLDVGTRWALRLPIEFGAGGFGKGAGYGELVVIPGALYRFRDDADQALVPYVGGGLRLGFVGIGKKLVGEPLVAARMVIACCHDWGDHDDLGGGGSSDPNTDTVSTVSGGISVEAWGGYEWHPSRWFSVNLAGAVGYERLKSTTVIVFRETLGIRLSI
jgi:hypothetical protein